ncbi:hypothetical protein I79_020836 [Cricetulus griseus]|uniref:Uncharacterized protein n=1 Tax=Cricetulus griseus TaxID=10029 RepID=G3IB47_CRIGR|nr:hypothetical protein I79_020836 [Cricetulus griseus]
MKRNPSCYSVHIRKVSQETSFKFSCLVPHEHLIKMCEETIVIHFFPSEAFWWEQLPEPMLDNS